MRILHQAFAMVALVVLVVQPVRIAYARWVETRTPGQDAEIRSVQAQILLISSLDELVARHEALRKQADELRRSQSDGPAGESLSQLDREPFRSESLYEGAISTWEASASELRQCRFYWFVGLGIFGLGLALYKMVNHWLGTALLIAAFGEFIYWTSPSAFIWSRVQEVDRLLTSQFVFSIISLLLLLLTIVILQIFRQERIGGSIGGRPKDEPARMSERTTKTCEECRSLFFGDSSEMDGLCPECAHLIYGYDPCVHTFVDGRCSRCHWDGSVSEYCRKLKAEDAR